MPTVDTYTARTTGTTVNASTFTPILGLQPATTGAEAGVAVLIESGSRAHCLLVDEVLGKQEVVIKSLGEGLGKVPGIAGGAILGDGRVGLILDMGGLWSGHACN